MPCLIVVKEDKALELDACPQGVIGILGILEAGVEKAHLLLELAVLQPLAAPLHEHGRLVALLVLQENPLVILIVGHPRGLPKTLNLSAGREKICW